MGENLKRKCDKCKGTIEVQRNNISEVLRFQEKYYHVECFKEMASKKAATKRGKPEMWKTTLGKIKELETEAKITLEHCFVRDDLNAYILSHYNIITVPKRFWNIVEDLENGIHKGKKCKSISIDILLETWKWGQSKLNSIAKNNKMNHTGPKDDDQRIMYDLAIVIGKIPNYLSHVSKMKMTQAEEKKENEKTHINYNNVQTINVENNDGLDDISGLLEDIF